MSQMLLNRSPTSPIQIVTISLFSSAKLDYITLIFFRQGDITGIRKIFPKAELKYIANVGHNVHAEDPSSFFKMVSEFLK